MRPRIKEQLDTISLPLVDDGGLDSLSLSSILSPPSTGVILKATKQPFNAINARRCQRSNKRIPATLVRSRSLLALPPFAPGRDFSASVLRPVH